MTDMMQRTADGRLAWEITAFNRGCLGSFSAVLAFFAVMGLGSALGLWMTREMPPILGLIGAAFFGLMSAVTLYNTGPNKFLVDPEKRTYTLLRGWPWHPKVRSGSLDEFRDISVQSYMINYTPYYKVMLSPQPNGPGEVVLENTDTRPKAETKACELSELLGIPFR